MDIIKMVNELKEVLIKNGGDPTQIWMHPHTAVAIGLLPEIGTICNLAVVKSNMCIPNEIVVK